MNGNKTALILRPEQALFDATDKSLYSFNERESMTKFREVSAVVALNRFFYLADSDIAGFVAHIAEKVPHLKKVFDSLKSKTQLVAKLSENAQQKLESGEWHWIFSKDGSGMLPALKDAAEHFAEQIRVGEIVIRPELLNSLISLTQMNNLNALTDKVIFLTDAVERIAAGQYNDRIAMFYGARQMYIEAMSMNDPENRRIVLINAAKSADEAIASLQQTIWYDLNHLANAKSMKIADSTRLISKCFSRLNDSVQISVNVYAALGESNAILASVRSYQCFIEQTLLSVPEKLINKKYTDCTLAEIMHSFSETDGIDWRQLPEEIVCACETIIQTERETFDVLCEELEPPRLGGQEDEM